MPGVFEVSRDVPIGQLSKTFYCWPNTAARASGKVKCDICHSGEGRTFTQDRKTEKKRGESLDAKPETALTLEALTALFVKNDSGLTPFCIIKENQ